ncbi:hypothetical protein BJY01DRAFT_53772 [Aspergillus pseudoustus]|uniref:Uncharacterized protein n=1 Tax=Aspergillus pseudoustus TaxID=1810923 RepID=A0ABR4J9E2_9EURO
MASRHPSGLAFIVRRFRQTNLGVSCGVLNWVRRGAIGAFKTWLSLHLPRESFLTLQVFLSFFLSFSNFIALRPAVGYAGLKSLLLATFYPLYLFYFQLTQPTFSPLPPNRLYTLCSLALGLILLYAAHESMILIFTYNYVFGSSFEGRGGIFFVCADYM